MLAITQKANILRRSGIAVPPAPVDAAANDGGPNEKSAALPTATAETAREAAWRTWTAQVNTLFVSYVAARAAKSLRDAEAVRQLDELRQLSAGVGRLAQPSRA